MTVHCPHCLTGYELPQSLMGEHGSRVRCPGCQGVFVVRPDHDPVHDPVQGSHDPGTAVAAQTGFVGHDRAVDSSSRAPQGSGDPVYEPAVVAGAVLDVMVDFLGDALLRSRERGTVLSDHGPAIVAVWEEYRRRAGADAPATEFRLALRDRCGVDLSPRALN